MTGGMGVIVPFIDLKHFDTKSFHRFLITNSPSERHHQSVYLPAGNDRAFTLMEVMLVIMLLGILTVLTVPSLLHSNDRWLLRSTAHGIANDIRRVQRMSVQECEEYKFELHTKKFYYKIMSEVVKSDPIKTVNLDSRITEITSTLYNPKYGGDMEGYRILQFSCLGSPNQGGEILLKTKNGNSIRITIAVATGRVHVYD